MWWGFQGAPECHKAHLTHKWSCKPSSPAQKKSNTGFLLAVWPQSISTQCNSRPTLAAKKPFWEIPEILNRANRPKWWSLAGKTLPLTNVCNVSVCFWCCSLGPTSRGNETHLVKSKIWKQHNICQTHLKLQHQPLGICSFPVHLVIYFTSYVMESAHTWVTEVPSELLSGTKIQNLLPCTQTPMQNIYLKSLN